MVIIHYGNDEATISQVRFSIGPADLQEPVCGLGSYLAGAFRDRI